MALLPSNIVAENVEGAASESWIINAGAARLSASITCKSNVVPECAVYSVQASLVIHVNGACNVGEVAFKCAVLTYHDGIVRNREHRLMVKTTPLTAFVSVVVFKESIFYTRLLCVHVEHDALNCSVVALKSAVVDINRTVMHVPHNRMLAAEVLTEDC